MNEMVIMITERQSMFRAVLVLEKSGYEVTDVLPLLRIIIVKLTPEQFKEIKDVRGGIWKNESFALSKKTPR